MYSGSTGYSNSGISTETYSEDADDGTRLAIPRL